MALIDLNESNYESVVTGEGIVVVDCWAAWCGACKAFAPIFENAAGRHKKHTFGKLDTQSEKSLVGELGIDHIPSLLLYRDGLLLFKQPGYYEEDKLDDIVRQAESLDMNEVRTAMAAEDASRGDSADSG